MCIRENLCANWEGSIPNVIEDLDLRPSQSPGIGRSNLAPISNRGDDSIAPIEGAFASVLNQTFSHVGYRYKQIEKIKNLSFGFAFLRKDADCESIFEDFGLFNS